MEMCQSLIKEMDKLQKSYKTFSSSSQSKMITLLSVFSELESEIEKTDKISDKHIQSLYSFQSQVKDVLNSISSEHRSLHPNVSKIGKIIERNYDQDISEILQPGYLNEGNKEELLNKTIQQYLYRHGHVKSAEHFAAESGLSPNEEEMNFFLSINNISASICEKNLEPALEWCNANQKDLCDLGSLLELKLFQLRFLSLLMEGDTNSALQFAQDMYHLVLHYPSEVEKVVGCVAYAKTSLMHSPYGSLYADTQWNAVSELFKKEAFRLKQIPVKCPLSTVINAGCLAIPSLLKMKSVILQQEKYDLSKYDELPIEIDLDPSMRFHSIFACPILRQQAVDEGTQPVRLVCGHLIGYDSMKKVSGTHGQFKCPYCPVQMHESEVMHIIL